MTLFGVFGVDVADVTPFSRVSPCAISEHESILYGVGVFYVVIHANDVRSLPLRANF